MSASVDEAGKAWSPEEEGYGRSASRCCALEPVSPKLGTGWEHGDRFMANGLSSGPFPEFPSVHGLTGCSCTAGSQCKLVLLAKDTCNEIRVGHGRQGPESPFPALGNACGTQSGREEWASG